MKVQNGLTGTHFQTGYEILKNKGSAIIGLSPGNSYFKKSQIDMLIKYCSNKFSQSKIMIPDKPSEHTYKALGYPESKAQKKARLNGNTLKNHSQQAISETTGNIKLINWEEEIEGRKEYQDELKKIRGLYNKNTCFREQARKSTRSVLEKKISQGIEQAVDEGIHYLLKELAFLSASPKIFNSEKTAYIYHEHWEIYEQFINGKFTGKKRKDLGFIIIK